MEATAEGHHHTTPWQVNLVASKLVGVEDEPLILEPALKHGVTETSILHALANPLGTAAQADGLTMIVGSNLDGTPLEIGVIDWHGTLAVVHAMRPARSKFLRRVRPW